MISIEFSRGVSEVLDILNHIEEKYVKKIPIKFMQFLESNKADSYVPNLDHSKKIYEMNLSEKAKNILAIIYMNYWCTPEQKADFIRNIENNEKNYKNALKENYDSSNIFNTKSNVQTNEEIKENSCNQIAEIKKESAFKKIIMKIKTILHLT